MKTTPTTPITTPETTAEVFDLIGKPRQPRQKLAHTWAHARAQTVLNKHSRMYILGVVDVVGVVYVIKQSLGKILGVVSGVVFLPLGVVFKGATAK